MCSRRRTCGGGGNSWSYSWSSDGGWSSTGNVPAQYVQSCGQQQQQQDSDDETEREAKSVVSNKGGSERDYYEEGLYLHNWYRKRHGAPKLVLTDRLNKIADAYAYKLACARQMVHSTGKDYGENLYMSSDTNASKKEHVRMACKMWYAEKKDYNFSNPGFSMQTGHFTAMVWKATTQVGIGCWIANGCAIVVANYKVFPNMQGEFGKNVLRWREMPDSDDEREEEKKKDEKAAADKKADEEKNAKQSVAKKTEEKDSASAPAQDVIPDVVKKDFDAKADENSTVGWSELKALLNENIKVQFNFEGFDKTICTLLISLMTIRTQEKKRVGLEEFWEIIKCVEGFLDAYTEFDVDNSGTLDPFELKAALEEAGFSVGYKTYQTLQKLFSDDESGDMKFRGFVLCFILLSKLQIVQEKKSAKKGGMLEDFSMKDWMQSEINAISPE